MNKLSDFKAGDRVLYLPGVAQGDPKHKACEQGVVTSVGAVFVFVRYGAELHSKATDPNDLINYTKNEHDRSLRREELQAGFDSTDPDPGILDLE